MNAVDNLAQGDATSAQVLEQWLDLIETWLRLGHSERALSVARRAMKACGEQEGLKQICAWLEKNPSPIDMTTQAPKLVAIYRCLDRGDHQRAAQLAESFVRQFPQHGLGWSLLSESRHALGDYPGALAAAQRGAELEPGDARLRVNLGVMLKANGELAAAQACFRQSIAFDPTIAPAHTNLAGLLLSQGDLAEAEACCRQALSLDPDQIEAHVLLARILHRDHRGSEALAAYQSVLARCTEKNAWQSEALLGAASVEAAIGNLAMAERDYRRALAMAPDDVAVIRQVAAFLAGVDQLQEASDLFLLAYELQPGEMDLLYDAGCALEALGYADKAEYAYRRVVARDPRFLLAWAKLGDLLRQCNRREEALEVYRRALEIADSSSATAAVRQNLGTLLVELARIDDAMAEYRLALDAGSDGLPIMHDMLFLMGFTMHWPPAQLRFESERWEGFAVSAAGREQARQRRIERPEIRGRRLRLGVLSSELGNHAVGTFLFSWLQALDRGRCELFLYPTRLRPEPEAAAFRQLSDKWTPLVGIQDRQAADRIRADGVDVLIETSGHTKNSRLGIIAHRAAPVQCHYVGYFATTGLTEMDYFIGDPVFTPADQDRFFTERVWRLPRTRYAYHPFENVPEPNWRPDPNGRLWLASFNQLKKVRDSSIRLWSQIMHAVPSAYLLLKDYSAEDPVIVQRIRAGFDANGISADRIRLLGHSNAWIEHMQLYNFVDLAVDTTPFTSATTGFDALWMGTPLVTLLGEYPASRQAASMLTGLGRHEWIARTPEDYVRIAVDLLHNEKGRRHIRLNQRQQMRGSELCDGQGLATSLQDAFFAMFNRWRETRGSPVASKGIDVG